MRQKKKKKKEQLFLLWCHRCQRAARFTDESEWTRSENGLPQEKFDEAKIRGVDTMMALCPRCD